VGDVSREMVEGGRGSRGSRAQQHLLIPELVG
jgi:hypothetical protein